MSILAPKHPKPCGCSTLLGPKMADPKYWGRDVNPWDTTPTASFGADAAAATPAAPSWLESPMKFFATLGVGMAIGYIVGQK